MEIRSDDRYEYRTEKRYQKERKKRDNSVFLVDLADGWSLKPAFLCPFGTSSGSASCSRLDGLELEDTSFFSAELQHCVYAKVEEGIRAWKGMKLLQDWQVENGEKR